VVLYLSALDRTRDFAVFKATGTSTIDLVLSLTMEAVLLSVIAGVLAVGISWLVVPLFPLQMSVPAGVALALPPIAVVVGLVGSLAGLRRAVQVDPALAFGAK
jgi:putative ABC transport system permease protein